VGVLVQTRRNKDAACAFLRRVLRTVTTTRGVAVTDTRRSYGAALREVLPGVEQRQHQGLKNRAEHAHQPTRRGERGLQRFTSPEHAQRVREPFGQIGHHFRPRRHLLPVDQYRMLMTERFLIWHEAAVIEAPLASR
jgi:putative transposase